MNDRDVEILKGRLIPVPKHVEFGDGGEFRLRDGCRIVLRVGETSGVAELTDSLCRRYWNVAAEPVVEAAPETQSFAVDAYKIGITETELSVAARGLTGVANAFKTLRQLAEVERGTERVTGHFLVPCEIDDAPALEFRGIHLCIFPETPLWDIEKQLRLAAYHKFNYAVIECWGVFPFESHPEMCWRDRTLDRGELKRLIRLGRELGITAIPQFNILGHATASRVCTGKHFVLDCDPSLQPLFEPAGWSWCLSNPETRRILTDLVEELHDFFDRPPFFHIGCDEAYDLGSCRECGRKPLKELVLDHILHFHDLLARRGARVMMWHDMLVEKGDARWRGYTANARPEMAELYRELPRDIVIADWQYGYPVADDGGEPAWPTVRFFADGGFDVLVCPWLNREGTVGLGRTAARERLLGMLATTWHISHDRKFPDIYGVAASAAWNPEATLPTLPGRRLTVALHTRQIGWDMGIDGYEKTGWCQRQVDPGTHPHELC